MLICKTSAKPIPVQVFKSESRVCSDAFLLVHFLGPHWEPLPSSSANVCLFFLTCVCSYMCMCMSLFLHTCWSLHAVIKSCWGNETWSSFARLSGPFFPHPFWIESCPKIKLKTSFTRPLLPPLNLEVLCNRWLEVFPKKNSFQGIIWASNWCWISLTFYKILCVGVPGPPWAE